MTRVLLVGAGEVGRKHLAALTAAGLAVSGIVEPDPAAAKVAGVGAPVFGEHQRALAVLEPDLVVVACPSGAALRVARDAAATGARVLVEKPVVVAPTDLKPAHGDDRIAVAFQPHFAPGVAELLMRSPEITHARVVLSCHRDRGYYRGWRTRWSSAGGILHQQAIHGLALVLRLWGMPEALGCTAVCAHHRGFADAEDRVDAALAVTGGRTLVLTGRVDSEGPPHHHVHLHGPDVEVLLSGRNLEYGTCGRGAARTHEQLRTEMYRAVIAAEADLHPCLFPLAALRPVLEVIDYVYRTARRAA